MIATASAHDSQVRDVRNSGAGESFDFVLDPAREATVRGVVVDAVGGPVSGALVFAQHGGLPEVVASAWTDEQGRFGLPVEPGHATLAAQADAYAPTRVEIEAPAEDVALVLAAASTLVGEVVEEASGRPVPGTVVSAYARSVAHPAALQTTADAAGRFRLTGLHSGTYELSAAGAEWGGRRVTASVGVAEVSAPVVLRVRPATMLNGVIRAGGESCPSGSIWLHGEAFFGAAADARGEISILGILPGRYDVDVLCPNGIALREEILIGARPVRRAWDLDTGSTLRGRVERANGEPLEGTVLQMLPVARPGAESERPRVAVHCANGEAGAFACQGLEPGEYEFALGSSAPVTAGSIVIGNAPDPGPVVLRAPPAASILVQIEGSASAAPSTFQVLALRGSQPPQRAEPSAEGHWLRDIPLGTYAVYLGPTSHVPETAPRALLAADGEIVRITLTPPTAHEIAGVVLDASGAPLPDVWLHAESPAAEMPNQPFGVPALTNERGEFLLQGLIPGAYDLVSNGAEPRRLLTSVNAGTRSVVLQLRE